MKITEITAEKKENKIQRLAAYCRVSSDSSDQLHSFAAQLRYYSNYEKQHPEFELVGIYADEGLSGTSMKKRAEMNRLIQDCEQGKIDRVIVKSISRFARNTHDLLQTLRLLKSYGVTVFFEEQGIDTSQLNSEMFLTFPGMIAQQESESISGNMRWSYKKRMESGEFNCCTPAYGFNLIDNYLEMHEYDWFRYSIEGNVEMHEFLEFKYKPKQIEVVDFIKDYLATLLRLSFERSPAKAEEIGLTNPVTLDLSLIIDDVSFTDDDMESLIHAIYEQLPNANSFKIDCKCDGVLREYVNEENNNGSRMNMIKKDAVWTGAGMLDTLEQYKRRNSFEYKLAIFYPDSGEFKYEKIINGKEIDVLSNGTEDIINKTFDEEWWSYNLNLWTDFDFEKYPEIIEQLHNIVRNNIPKSEVSYCESTWEFGDINVLCSGIQWNCSSLSEIQSFLDKLNKVLLPIKDEVNAGGEGTWEVKNEFAVATWEWTDQGFKVKGCLY